MWEPATGETPDGDTLAASDAGQQAAKAQLVIAERLADLSDFDRLWRQA
jgi:hypothetical protein